MLVVHRVSLLTKGMHPTGQKAGRRVMPQVVMRTPSPVGITTRSRIAGCRSVTTPIQLRDCHTSMNTTCQSMKLRTSSVDHCKTYADVMILALRSVRLERDDI